MTVTTLAGAVFVSYASQDAEAAQRICSALRDGGIEVWFDKSELRGGDAWDQKIRRQIRDCALFLPVISSYSQARSEGYFRLEWRLADQRTHLMGRGRSFLVPVCVDDTSEAQADAPDSFEAVQWTRLPGGATPLAFVERIRELLAPEPHVAAPAGQPQAGSAPAVASRPATRQPAASRWLRPVPLLVVAALILALGYLGVDRFLASKRAAVARSAATAAEKSIAVLPFVDLSQSKDQEYLSDGISEELLNLLGKVSQLRVVARTSSFSFKGKNIDVAEIARKLNVTNVLEGSVRKAGDTVRITVQLIRADDSSQLWSENYDRSLNDIFKVQDEIAATVVAKLRITLLGAAPTTRAIDPKAYQLILQAKYLTDLRKPESRAQALALLLQALAITPDEAPAWDILARVYTNQLSTRNARRPRVSGWRARPRTRRWRAIPPTRRPTPASAGSRPTTTATSPPLRSTSSAPWTSIRPTSPSSATPPTSSRSSAA